MDINLTYFWLKQIDFRVQIICLHVFKWRKDSIPLPHPNKWEGILNLLKWNVYNKVVNMITRILYKILCTFYIMHILYTIYWVSIQLTHATWLYKLCAVWSSNSFQYVRLILWVWIICIFRLYATSWIYPKEVPRVNIFSNTKWLKSTKLIENLFKIYEHFQKENLNHWL